LYFYEQIFEGCGIKTTKKDFFVVLRLDDPYSGKNSVKPHEKTLAKSKADRLRLLKATKANISHVFCLKMKNLLLRISTLKRLKNIYRTKNIYSKWTIDMKLHGITVRR